MGLIIVILIRLLVPLVLFKNRILGIILCIVADWIDYNLLTVIGTGNWPDYYQNIDKALDLYYLTIELYLSLSWRDPRIRKLSIFSYAWRTIGVVLFEITKIRQLFIIFPNVFEFVFIFHEFNKHFNKKEPFYSMKQILQIAFGALFLKEIQEVTFHNGVFDFWCYLDKIFKGRISC